MLSRTRQLKLSCIGDDCQALTNGIDTNLTIPTTAGLYCSELPGNPRFGHQSFDDFGSALLTMFTCITLEDWDQAGGVFRTTTHLHGESPPPPPPRVCMSIHPEVTQEVTQESMLRCGSSACSE